MTMQILKRFAKPIIALIVVLFIGTIGYVFIGGEKYSFIDCLYMAVITIATIGYGEIIDMSGNPAGRIFTMFLAFSGIGILTYTLSNATAFFVEGTLTETFRRRKMEKIINKLQGHYIVCGIEGEGFHIIRELYETKRPRVIVDVERKRIEKVLETFKEQVFVEGDATDSDTLLRAGVKEARGLFAATGDDHHNLIISLTAKQLNPSIKVVARCNDIKNMEKIKSVNADAIVLPAFIGGLRMASEMVRPTVVSFLDVMLRDKEKALRIEEIAMPESFSGRSISDLNLKNYQKTLLLAVRTKDDWFYNPPDNFILGSGHALIFMTTPEERIQLEGIFSQS